MCGIAGFYSPSGFGTADGEIAVARMSDQLIHRGPDDAGIWVDEAAGIALAHRRLSIVDLSPAGHQPMVSSSGRFVLVFNGEIYNHQEIRRQLDGAGGPAWRSHSDTETLLAAIEQWGLTPALQTAVGMFALALWDRQDRSLTLARDRMGEKPLYYGWQRETLLFASELKAVRGHPAFCAEINRDILPLYLRHGYIPAPYSPWRGVHKLLPGTTVRIDAAQMGTAPDPVPYWSLGDAILCGQADPFRGSDEEAIDCVEAQLGQAIAGQRMADVPLGAFLSGGIDSSTVVALMQAQASRPVKTFTIGFREDSYNEAGHAKAVAAHLGTDHTELYLSSQQVRDVIPDLPVIYDEPFGDSSAIPTHLVSRLARQEVAVSLSGDGGDELFGGYSRYFNRNAIGLWRAGRRLPTFLRRPTGAVLRATASVAGRSVAAKLALAGQLLECDALPACYRVMTSQWQPAPVIGAPGTSLPYGLPDQTLNQIQDAVPCMMAIDSATYLPDDILAKVDRAAMAVSLETRVPLLDHRLVELAWRLPHGLKIRNGQGKWILRQLLYRHVPRALIDRPKAGFAVPVDAWLRGSLRDWAESLIGSARLKQEGFLDAQAVRERWRDHLEGVNNWRDSLWLILMWQAWIEKNIQ